MAFFDQYVSIVVLAAIAGLLVFMTLILPYFFAPRNPKGYKLEPYECGEEPIGSNRGPYALNYYMFILLFLIFDLEAVFLLPWALSYDGLGLDATVAVAIFVGLLTLEFAYAWKRGLLTWTR